MTRKNTPIERANKSPQVQPQEKPANKGQPRVPLGKPELKGDASGRAAAAAQRRPSRSAGKD
ncbi:MAG TPA: hypothetical protein VER33_13510 [Polyangiaceae bacterium]|nr:hypothetical protein [Polyangiaceae bacterium]